MAYTKEEIRQMREEECFSYINRGNLWYEKYVYPDPGRNEELNAWYRAWLKATETGVIPEKPSWLDEPSPWI